MKPVQITMDEELLRQVDALPEVKRHGRSAVLRQIMAAYLRHRQQRAIRDAYRKGYGAQPVGRDEFAVDPEFLAWPEGEA